MTKQTKRHLDSYRHNKDIRPWSINKRFHFFTFTGKERDEETGYGYFGARYMDHELMTMWLSVDPMADKYPSISPYNYCMWNPIKLVDPDGKDTTVSINLSNGNITYHASDEHAKGTTVQLLSDNTNPIEYKCKGLVSLSSNNMRQTLSFSEENDAETVFGGIIGNNAYGEMSQVEWNYYQQKNGTGDLVTSNRTDYVNVTGLEQEYNEAKTLYFSHFHPQLIGYAWWIPSESDQRYASSINVPSFLYFGRQKYRFDNIVRAYGIMPQNEFEKHIPYGISKITWP